MSSVKSGGVAARHIPGEPGIWVMVFGDMIVFGLFFVTFAVYRLGQAAQFMAAQARLDQRIGLANTLILLTSSMAVAVGLEQARRDRPGQARRAVEAGMVLGAAFIVMKVVEYRAKVAAGILPSTGEYYMFYYGFTGIHLLHVVAGIGALAYMRHAVARPTPQSIMASEGCAIFWHLVDILWVMIFAILYLHR